VQIITLLGRITLKHGRFPALVVVPNSTIMNWVREFAAWAPQIRAVPYYGEAASREIMKRYEIFHDKAQSNFTKLKFHVLLTTYETFNNRRGDREWSSVFNGPSRWEILVIDEGQRCKHCDYSFL
jgi:chromodomain-helicase-DNA-binding protein 4